MTRRVPILLCVALAGAALVAGTLAGLSLRTMPADTGDTSTAAAIGGDFELTAVDGQRVALSSLRGTVVALFFGYTHCPDICPGTLHVMKLVRGELGEDAGHLRALMVSVDPKRDTPERLDEYVRYFDPTFIGLTGSQQEIDAIVARFGAAYTLGDADASGSYTVDHTSLVYLIDGDGQVRHLLASTSGVDQMLPLVRELIAEL